MLTQLSLVKGRIQRFSCLILVLLSILLIGIDKSDTSIIEDLRIRNIDLFMPIRDVLSYPIFGLAWIIDVVKDLHTVYEANQVLHNQNEQLLWWKERALYLESENRSLRTVLNVIPDSELRIITARVTSSPEAMGRKAIVINAGEEDGVRRGQIAMTQHSIIGRVTELSARSARILLIQDPSMRIPVRIEGSSASAMLIGDHINRPYLRHLDRDVQLAIGNRVVTSSVGGRFPAGFLVGLIAHIDGQDIRVQPLVELNRLEYVVLVDFGLEDHHISAENDQPL